MGSLTGPTSPRQLLTLRAEAHLQYFPKSRSPVTLVVCEHTHSRGADWVESLNLSSPEAPCPVIHPRRGLR